MWRWNMGAIKWVKINRYADDYQPFVESQKVFLEPLPMRGTPNTGLLTGRLSLNAP